MSEAHRPLREHPVRAALLDLIGRLGAATATDAARELGGTTGLYSFHLRQLAEAGLIEQAPTEGGRARPWRLPSGTAALPAPTDLATPTAPASLPAPATPTTPAASAALPNPEKRRTPSPSGGGAASVPGEQQAPSDAEISPVARGLEEESYRQWLERRGEAPERWRRDEAFSQVVYLTPEEMAGVAEVVRAVIDQFRHREDHPSARPEDAAPVAVMARLFPLL